MSAEVSTDSHLEIGHVLFVDIVGYSKLLSGEQREVFALLNDIVRNTPQFRAADAGGKLVRIPTGDGMALVFFTSVDAPVHCAREISRTLCEHPELSLRMGINSGPIDHAFDVNERQNVTGAGINVAQRVMNCADAGHILLSRRVADDLAQYIEWQPYLHELGDVEVKHGVRLNVVNFYGDGIGNPSVPNKIQQAEQERAVYLARTRKVRRRRVILLASAAVLLLIGIGLGTWVWQRRAALASAYKLSTAGIVEKSIAVLPFEYFGGDKDNAYLADGVQDDILTDLAKVADLKVISRRSVAQFRDSKQTVREIGEALGVAYVLEGTVRKAGDKLRISAQLIDTRTEAEKWAEKYERELADVFAIQNEISETIASQLKATLSPAEKSAIETMPTHDMQAYDLYLRARALVHTFGTYAKQREENRVKAKPLLEAAIARDPKFVLAYCLLAEAQCSNEDNNATPEQIALARSALDTALQLAPESGEVHLQLGFFFYAATDEADRAKEEFTIALRKLPNSVPVHSALADLERDNGNWREALNHAKRAAELDPRDPGTAVGLADMYAALRRYDEAEKLLDRMVPIVPFASSAWLWWGKGAIAIARGDTKAAMAAYDSSPLRHTGTVGLNREIARVLLFERRYDEAATLLESMEETARANGTFDDVGVSDSQLLRGYTDLGIVRRAQAKPELARTVFELTKAKWAAWLTKHPGQPTGFAHQAMCDAGLGNKEAALHELRRVQELWPKWQPLSGVAAVVYAWCGDHTAALSQLEAIVDLPDSLTPGDLKLNPQWDELRHEPRFERVIARATRPVKID
jgi:TolB-like protein/Tfp pilus assembly protein PilF